MNFTIQNSIQILERTPGVLKALLQNISDDWTLNNEGEKTWKLTNPLYQSISSFFPKSSKGLIIFTN